MWFSKKARQKPRLKTDIGTFTFDATGWMTEPTEHSLIITSCHAELSLAAIDKARTLLGEIDKYSSIAVDFAKRDGGKVWDGKGELVLESVDITDILDGDFGLTFGLHSEPDFTVTVEFRDGKPQVVWGTD